ncbi:unnamed protein product [Prorocentrum cordatum]|uniref:RRM domain-containing protein n=1 Tax=Prorocentrum cordatum TaxID=2364126 RepID=A0ABN9WP23_9DINO|nr:unnamed protein product [Polarella glacialis]
MMFPMSAPLLSDKSTNIDADTSAWTTHSWHVKNTFVEVDGIGSETRSDHKSGRTARSCQPRIRMSSLSVKPTGEVQCEAGATGSSVVAAPAVASAAAVGTASVTSAETAQQGAHEADRDQGTTAVPGSACREQQEHGRGKTSKDGSLTCMTERPHWPSSTIGDQLKLLQREHDHQCVFVARRLHTLSFASERLVASHFSAFGQVKRVLIAHTKATRSLEAAARVRPGSIGFVVMAHASAVTRILESGSQQVVAGKSIVLEPFRPGPL